MSKLCSLILLLTFSVIVASCDRQRRANPETKTQDIAIYHVGSEPHEIPDHVNWPKRERCLEKFRENYEKQTQDSGLDLEIKDCASYKHEFEMACTEKGMDNPDWEFEKGFIPKKMLRQLESLCAP